MLKEDFVIQSNIRRMVIRSNIDYSRMDFGTVKGVVYIRGIFQVSRLCTDGDEEKGKEFAVKTLYSFEKKVRSIPGVSDVIFQLLNWRKERGQWVPIEMKKEEEEDEDEDEKKTESHL
jgi:hypothetical protein